MLYWWGLWYELLLEVAETAKGQEGLRERKCQILRGEERKNQVSSLENSYNITAEYCYLVSTCFLTMWWSCSASLCSSPKTKHRKYTSLSIYSHTKSFSHYHVYFFHIHYLSSSCSSVSMSNLYWNPEQPPPSTITLKKDVLSSFPRISFSLATQESLSRRSDDGSAFSELAVKALVANGNCCFWSPKARHGCVDEEHGNVL